MTYQHSYTPYEEVPPIYCNTSTRAASSIAPKAKRENKKHYWGCPLDDIPGLSTKSPNFEYSHHVNPVDHMTRHGHGQGQDRQDHLPRVRSGNYEYIHHINPAEHRARYRHHTRVKIECKLKLIKHIFCTRLLEETFPFCRTIPTNQSIA